ncbi:MAG: alpha-galactosidase [Angelakisella sp.]|jgi:alpha-galactosidase|nr:alpha-galactosidase [Angelakisella sp.]
MIILDEKNRVFTLHTHGTTYQMKADRHDVLVHTYYGPRVSGGDLSYLIQYADRGFSPNPSGAGRDRTYSLDTTPQEYSTCGVGDFRLPSLELELEDGSLLCDLRYTGHRLEKGKYSLPGLPAFFGGEEWETLAVTLSDAAAQVEVELLYGVLAERDLITRAARITNRGSRKLRLRQAASLCLDFHGGDRDHDLITFNGCHAMERCLDRSPLRPGIQSVGSVRGTSSHHHNPFVILCEKDAGEDHGLCIGAALLYSGNFQAAAERTQLENDRLTLGIHPFHFCWTLAPGEAFVTPEAAMVCSTRGFGEMSRQFHRAIREHLLRDPLAGRRHPVLINNWEATEFDFTADKLVEIAGAAAKLGIELFVMDDGWFGKRDDDYSSLGDWQVDQRKLPGGLTALVPRIRELGMQFGIWVEPEMVSQDSDLYRQHPDWALGAPGRSQTLGRSQLVLDFSRREVREHVYGELKKVLDSADIRYVKWDMNRSLTDVWSAALPPERQGEVYHRYVLGLYDMLEQLHRDYPNILIEGCSGGGGRFDAGMLYYTPQIWCSDNTDAIDRLRIQYGTSFCYPVATMGAHVSAVPNAQTGRTTPMETRGVVAMSGTFGYEMDLNKCTAAETDTAASQVAEYKKLWRLIGEGDYYRLTDPWRDGPFTAWEQVSPDRREALVSVVTHAARATPPFLALRLAGLDPDLRYRVEGREGSWPGDLLMNGGWPMPMPVGDYQAFQLHLYAE